MPLIRFDLALLVLVLMCPMWWVSLSLPVIPEGQTTDSCVSCARTLLDKITGALAKDELFTGINCTQQNMELNTDSNTLSVCAPKGSSCAGVHKLNQPEFDQHSCLKNINKDLQYYYNFLAVQPDPDHLLGPVLSSLRELMENCFTRGTDVASRKVPTDDTSTYDDRLNLCKVLKGFQVRTITINRATEYMNSGEQTR